MAVKTHQETTTPAYVQTVEEIMNIYRSLPPRPSIAEVTAAKAVLQTVQKEEEMKLEEISKQERSKDVPEDIFHVSQAVKRNHVFLQSHVNKSEANALFGFHKIFVEFDKLIRAASQLIQGEDADLGGNLDFSRRILEEEDVEDDTLLSGTNDGESYSLVKVAGIIEMVAKNGEGVLDLEDKLIQVLPISIGKLTGITELNISDNHLKSLPVSIGNLKALTMIDAHSNQLEYIPGAIGELINVVDINLSGNMLESLPAAFWQLRNLRNLDLNYNKLTVLHEGLGNLSSLKTLSVEHNKLEEVPYSIGSCCALEELRLSFNNIKALPEATGNIVSLKVLAMYHNKLQGLPTTIGKLENLKELNVSFNAIKLIPDQLCHATSLVKLNISQNFTDVKTLPYAIGNLELLEELDISDNQIEYLPDSFRFLSNLRVFLAGGNPFSVPSREEVASLGAQEIVEYMDNLAKTRDVKAKQPTRQKSIWKRIRSMLGPKKASTCQDSNH